MAVKDTTDKDLVDEIWGGVQKDTERRAQPPQERKGAAIKEKEEEGEEEKDIDFDLSDKDKEEAKDDFEVPSDEDIVEEEEEEEVDTKTPKGQFKTLRSQRDDARTKLKDAEDKILDLEKNLQESQIPEELKEVIGDKTIAQIAEDNKILREQLKEHETERDGLKSRLRDVSIDNDPDFIKNYQQPIVDALDGFDALVSEVDMDGNVLYPQHIAKLKEKIFQFKDGAPVANAREVKAVLNAFAKEYKATTGEDYDMPSPTDVIRGVRDLASLYEKKVKVRSEWESEKELAKADTLKSEQARSEERGEVMRKDRVAKTSECLDSFDYDKYACIGSEKEVKDLLIEASQDMEKMLTDPSSQPSWDEMIKLRFMAKNFDKLIGLMEEGMPDDEDDGNHRSSDKPSISKASIDADVNWLDEITDQPINR